MLITGIPDSLPEGVVAESYRIPTPDDVVLEGKELVMYAGRQKPSLVVVPAHGYEFRYSVYSDRIEAFKK